MPRAAPVTITTLPSSCIGSSKMASIEVVQSTRISRCSCGRWPGPSSQESLRRPLPWRWLSGQPAFAPLVVLDLAIGLARADFVKAEIEFTNVGIGPQRVRAALQHDPPVLHHVAMLRHVERHGGVLFDEEDGEFFRHHQLADDSEKDRKS